MRRPDPEFVGQRRGVGAGRRDRRQREAPSSPWPRARAPGCGSRTTARRATRSARWPSPARRCRRRRGRARSAPGGRLRMSAPSNEPLTATVGVAGVDEALLEAGHVGAAVAHRQLHRLDRAVTARRGVDEVAVGAHPGGRCRGIGGRRRGRGHRGRADRGRAGRGRAGRRRTAVAAGAVVVAGAAAPRLVMPPPPPPVLRVAATRPTPPRASEGGGDDGDGQARLARPLGSRRGSPGSEFVGAHRPRGTGGRTMTVADRAQLRRDDRRRISDEVGRRVASTDAISSIRRPATCRWTAAGRRGRRGPCARRPGPAGRRSPWRTRGARRRGRSRTASASGRRC